jgi:hypothetical protein
MNRLIRIAVVGCIIVAAGAATWGCNDKKDKELTLEEYFQKVDAIDNDSTARTDAVFADLGDDSEMQEFQDAFKAAAPILADAARDFDDLNPPDEAKNEHDAMAAALNNFADKMGDIADAVDDIDASTPDELFAAIDEQGFTDANNAFTEKCLALQELATDKGIDVEIDCGDDEEASTDAEQTVRDVAAAWNAKDVDAFLTHFTDAGLSSAFGDGEPVSRDDIVAGLQEDIGDGTIEARDISSETTDAGADVTVLWASGFVMERFRFSLIQDAGEWKINAQENLGAEPAPGSAVVDVNMNEFAFNLDTADIPDGQFSFRFTNGGQQPHQAIIQKIPADLDLQAALASDEEPEDVVNVAGMAPMEPGSSETVVFANKLEPGRYVLLCFVPDTAEGPDGTPHAFKGMVKEFSVQ